MSVLYHVDDSILKGKLFAKFLRERELHTFDDQDFGFSNYRIFCAPIHDLGQIIFENIFIFSVKWLATLILFISF